MVDTDRHGSAMTLRDYLQVVKRRKWVIITAVVVVPAAAIAFSLHQTKLYQANAQVLLQQQNLASLLTGTAQSSAANPQNADQTQADLARVSAIAKRVLQSVPGTGLTAGGFLGHSDVSLATSADLLTFSVTVHDPQLARRLVNAYAAAYTVYRRQLDTAAITKALHSVTVRIHQLRAARQGGPLYTALVERQQTLQTMAALQTSNASVVQLAERATQTQPKTTRNAILAFVLGLVLGLGLVFLRESLDTQVRSAEEISERLGHTPLLARLPAPPKRFAEWHLAMVDEPYAPHAEAFRVLRTNLDFASLGRDVRTVMITSALEKEGKSTTIANLAVALARSGKRVVLVDLDLRRPTLSRFFALDEQVPGTWRHDLPGVTQVALGYASLEEALVPIALTEPSLAAVSEPANGNGSVHGGSVRGVLEVLLSGPLPPDPGEFVGSLALGNVLAELRERADFVLIDSPPLLPFGDSLALSSKVDGIILAARIKLVRRNVLQELARQIATVPTPVLGVVVTDASAESRGYGYGYGYGYRQASPTFETGERARAGSET